MRLHGDWNINFILYMLNTEAVSGSSPMLGVAFNILALMLIWLIHLNCARKNIRLNKTNKTEQDVWSIVILKSFGL